MKRLLMVMASAVLLTAFASPTFANHKERHHQPPGHDWPDSVGGTAGTPGEHTNVSHKTTVDSNAGIGDGGENHVLGGAENESTKDKDPGASKTNPAGGNANN